MPAPLWLTRSQNPWILVLVAGVCTTLLGLLVLFNPWRTFEALIFLVGIAFLISGVATILEHDERFPRSVTILSGVIWILAGALILAWPEETVRVLAVLAGLGLVIRGVVRAAIAVNEQVLHKTYYVVMGVVNVGLGLVVIFYPEPALTVLTFLIGINIFIAGILEVAMAFDLRESGRFH